jgi:hypothetical protein
MEERSPDLLFTAAVCPKPKSSPASPYCRKVVAVTRCRLRRWRCSARILPAVIYAELFALRRSASRPAATADLMIAAIARAHGASVVTRNRGNFEGCGLALINP